MPAPAGAEIVLDPELGAPSVGADGTITQGGLLGFMEALAARVQEVYGWFQNSLIPALAAFGGWVQQNSSWLGFLAVALGAAGAVPVLAAYRERPVARWFCAGFAGAIVIALLAAVVALTSGLV